MLLSAVRGTEPAYSNSRQQDEETLGGYYEERGESPQLDSGQSAAYSEVRAHILTKEVMTTI